MTAERPRPFDQHDLLVVIVGLALLAAGGLAFHSMTAPEMSAYSRHGLTFEWPGNWLPSEMVAPAPPRLMAGVDAARGPTTDDQDGLPLHEIYSYAKDPDLRLEVKIEERPRYGNLRGVLSFERRNRYGELYRQQGGGTVNLGGTDWLWTRYQYAYKPEKSHAPQTATALEYATVAGEQIYAVTIHGPSGNGDREVEWLADLIAPTLTVPTVAGVSQVTQLLASGKRIHREVVKQALPSVVMIMAVDLLDGRLVPVSGGSGTIVSRNGSILTNFHVINDEERERLHDLFVIGRFRGEGSEPEYVCAGRPNRSKLQPDLDLALIKCDLDMDGQPWSPHDWPALPVDLSETALRGERIWVIGYPNVGGGAISASTGEVTGLVTGDTDGATAFLVTTASITFGSSGGAAIDEDGFYLGVPTAFRARARIEGDRVTRLGDEGLIQPVQRAADLLAVAQAGWTPTLGANQVAAASEPLTDELEPGVQVSSVVRDAANDNPITGAVVIVFEPGISADDVDLNRLHEQTLTWSRTDEQGRFTLQQRVPRGQAYTVAVLAKGYEPLIETGVLRLEAGAPGRFDPWGVVHLER